MVADILKSVLYEHGKAKVKEIFVGNWERECHCVNLKWGLGTGLTATGGHGGTAPTNRIYNINVGDGPCAVPND